MFLNYLQNHAESFFGVYICCLCYNPTSWTNILYDTAQGSGTYAIVLLKQTQIKAMQIMYI